MRGTDIRKLLIKGTLFVALFFIVDRASGYIFHLLENKALQHSPNGMITEYTMEKVDSDIIILGASDALHSYVSSIIKDSLRMSVYNCGKDGMRFYYQNAMVDGILNRYSPKLIIWSISPAFLSIPSQEDRDAISDLNPWYRTNEFCHDAILMKSAFEWIKMCSYLYAYNSRLYAYLYKCIMPDYSYQYGGYSPVYGNLSDGEIKKRNYSEDSELDEKSATVLRNTLKRCKDAGTDVIFILTPRYELSEYEHIPQYVELKNILDEYNIRIITDLFMDKEILNPRYFKDAAHVNHDGAVIFTTKLVNEIKSVY